MVGRTRSGNRGRDGHRELVEAPPHMRSAEGKLDVPAFGKGAVAAITINLQYALESGPMGDRSIFASLNHVADHL